MPMCHPSFHTEGSPKEHRSIHFFFDSSLPTFELLFSRYQDPKLQGFHKLCMSFHIFCPLQERPSSSPSTVASPKERGGVFMLGPLALASMSRLNVIKYYNPLIGMKYPLANLPLDRFLPKHKPRLPTGSKSDVSPSSNQGILGDGIMQSTIRESKSSTNIVLRACCEGFDQQSALLKATRTYGSRYPAQ